MTPSVQHRVHRLPHEGDVLAYRDAETIAARRELAREFREWHAVMIAHAVTGGREPAASDLYAFTVWQRVLRLHTLSRLEGARA